MKQLYTIMLAVVLTLTASYTRAQMVTDMVSIQAGYTNQSFYSMANGEITNVTNTDWDLAFQLRGYAASIFINSKRGVNLWKANKDIAQWSSMTAADTTGILSDPAYQLFNTDTSWDFGAFNMTNDVTNQFDLGWGVYNYITHVITGDSVYFIKVGTGDVRKLRIDDLTSGIYNFRYANLDGSNEVVATLNKQNFQNKFFGYYSIVNSTTIDREPVYNAWDLTFCQYFAQTPIAYMVTGVLSNDSVFVAKAYPVDTAITTPGTYTFSNDMNAIAYDWKSFNMATFSWDIADSTVYFVQDRAGSLWKMIFTGFGGSGNGNFIFEKGPAVATGLIENSSLKSFGVYPNPTSGITRMMLQSEVPGNANIQIMDLNGKIILQNAQWLNSGLNPVDLDLSTVPSGIYQAIVRQGDALQVSRIVVE